MNKLNKPSPFKDGPLSGSGNPNNAPGSYDYAPTNYGNSGLNNNMYGATGSNYFENLPQTFLNPNVSTSSSGGYAPNFMNDYANTDSSGFYDAAAGFSSNMQDIANNAGNVYAGLQFGQQTNAFAGAQNQFGGAQNAFGNVQNMFAQGQNMYSNVQTFGDQLTNPFANAQNVYQGAQGVMGGATNVYGGVQNAYANIENPYDNSRNAFDNLTVNTQQANFQRSQQQQSQGDVMRQAMAGGGSGGMGGLVQMMAGEALKASAMSSASIGQQESQINMQRAQENSRIQQQQQGAAFEISKMKAQGEQQAEMSRLGGEDQLQKMQLGEQSQLQMARLGEASKLQGLDMQTRLDIQKTIMSEQMQAQQMKLSGKERYQQMVLGGAMDAQKLKMMGAADVQKMILQGAADLQSQTLSAENLINYQQVMGQFEADKTLMLGESDLRDFQMNSQNMFHNQQLALAYNADANYWGQMGFNQAEQQFAWQANNPIPPPANVTNNDNSRGGGCFHPSATVELEDGTVKTMKQVNYGDKVKAVNKNGGIIFSEVWKDLYINNKDNTTLKYYVAIKAGDSVLRVTKMHTIFVNNLQDNVCAWKVQPGMSVNVIEGGGVVLKTVDSVTHGMDYGLYDCFTKEGTVVANGIIAGTLAYWPHEWAQWWHKFFNKHPRLYKLGHKYIFNPIFNKDIASESFIKDIKLKTI